MDTKDLLFWCLSFSKALIISSIVLMLLFYWAPGRWMLYNTMEFSWWLRGIAMTLL